jgi:farnesyl-diphosphate farnesyltransferase
VASAAAEELWPLLRDVSRSFYRTLRVLPAPVRQQIGLAYLFARATDTIADTELVPPAQRLDALRDLRQRILGERTTPLTFSEFARHQGAPAERTLLENCETYMALLQTLSADDLRLVREVLDTITGGQELDLRRFGAAGAENIIALRVDPELDDYTYRVAGCVGEFWTRICRAHLFPRSSIDDAFLLANGRRFGQGLQLVNILRDLPVDLRKGRCYLPIEELSRCGLTPADLLLPSTEPRFRPLYNKYLDRAEAHLCAGWDYTNVLPRRCVRVRLACAWPILIGRATLGLLREGNVLEPDRRIKISRREVRQILMRSLLLYPFSGAWKRMAEGMEG